MSSSIDRKIAASKARQDAAEKQAQVQDVNGRMRTNIPGNEAANPVGTFTRKDAGKIISGGWDADTYTPDDLLKIDTSKITTITPGKFGEGSNEGCHVMHMGKIGKIVVHAAMVQEELPVGTMVSCTYIGGTDLVFKFKLPNGVSDCEMVVTREQCNSREWLAALRRLPCTTKYDDAIRLQVLKSLGMSSLLPDGAVRGFVFKKGSDFTVGAPGPIVPYVNDVPPYLCRSAYTPDDFLKIDTSRPGPYSAAASLVNTGMYYDSGPNYTHTPAVDAKAKRDEFVREHNNEIMHWLRDNDPSLKTVDDMLQAMSILAKEMIKHTAEVYEEGRVAGVLDAPWPRK